MNNNISYFLSCLLLISFQCTLLAAEPWKFSEKIKNGDIFENIMLAGAVKIPPGNDPDKMAREMSGIAWDNDEQILYGISDDGYIVHMQLKITENNILEDVEIISTHRLKDITGKEKNEADSDAEGITLDRADNNIKGDTEIVLVLDNPARAERYSITGVFIDSVPLHNNLSRLSENPAFQINAIAGNNETGYMFLTKERVDYKDHQLYIGTESEKPVTLNSNASINIVGADYIVDNGLFILDRNYKSMWQPVIYCVRRIINYSRINTIACFNSQDGWNLDNFEAIAHYRDNYFLMMSDDEESFFQKTLLVMFKIIKSE